MEFCCISLAKKTEPQIAHRHAFIDADIPPRITIRRVIFIESDSERIPRSLLRGWRANMEIITPYDKIPRSSAAGFFIYNNSTQDYIVECLITDEFHRSVQKQQFLISVQFPFKQIT
jgi:hypothetical protein